MSEWDAYVTTVTVKKVIDRFSAELVPIREAHTLIENGVKNAVSRKVNKNSEVKSESVLVIRWQSSSVALHLAGLPGVILKDERTIEIHGSITSLYRQMVVFFKVAASLTNQQPYC